MLEKRLIEVVNDYLSTASEEERTRFIEAHRQLEYFYLDHHVTNDEYGSVGDFFAKASGLLDGMAEEIGIEDNETYYNRISAELKQKHRQQEFVENRVLEYATIEA